MAAPDVSVLLVEKRRCNEGGKANNCSEGLIEEDASAICPVASVFSLRLSKILLGSGGRELSSVSPSTRQGERREWISFFFFFSGKIIRVIFISNEFKIVISKYFYLLLYDIVTCRFDKLQYILYILKYIINIELRL